MGPNGPVARGLPLAARAYASERPLPGRGTHMFPCLSHFVPPRHTPHKPIQTTCTVTVRSSIRVEHPVSTAGQLSQTVIEPVHSDGFPYNKKLRERPCSLQSRATDENNIKNCRSELRRESKSRSSDRGVVERISIGVVLPLASLYASDRKLLEGVSLYVLWIGLLVVANSGTAAATAVLQSAGIPRLM